MATGTNGAGRQPRVAIACLFRNSAFYLPEWIEFHRLVGIEHFFLRDHLSEDGGADLLAPHVATGLVTLSRDDREFDPERFEEQIHVPFFNECLAAARGRFDWLACLDSDEFMVPVREGDDVRAVLARFMRVDCAAIGINWQLYGTSGLQRLPAGRLLTECLVRKAHADDRINAHLKPVVRPERVARILGPHAVTPMPGRGFHLDMSGVRVTGPTSPTVVIDQLRLNHYNTGTAEHFERYKVPFYRRYGGQSSVAHIEGVCARARDMAFCDVEDGIMKRWGAPLRTLVFGQPRVAVVFHAAYASEWPLYRRHMKNVAAAGIAHDFYATLAEGTDAAALADALAQFGHRQGGPEAHVWVATTPNRGLDGGPWLAAARAMRDRARQAGPYDVVLKVHTKSPRNGGPTWRASLLDAVLGSPARAAACVAALAADPELGMVGAPEWIVTERPRADVLAMATRLGLAPDPAVDARPLQFIGGTMFWARWAALVEPLAACDADAVLGAMTPGFPERVETDGHMMERVFGLMVARAGLDLRGPPDSGDAGNASHNPSGHPTHVRRLVERALSLPNGGRAPTAAAVAAAAAATDTPSPDYAMPLADTQTHGGDGGVPEQASVTAATPIPVSAIHRMAPPGADLTRFTGGAMAIESAYLAACTTPSDINEHVPTLLDYAAQCGHITECGVRSCVSTWAFLLGLLRNGTGVRAAGGTPRLMGIDLQWHDNVRRVIEAAASTGIVYEFRCCDDVATELEETDLLFIDTWHVYAHLKRELDRHHSRVRRWIVLPDTTVDADLGESIRMGCDIAAQARASGYPESDIRRGLWPAVTEFVEAHAREWRIAQRYTHCNGLTILERVAGGAAVPCS